MKTRLFLVRSKINSNMFLTESGEMMALIMCGPGGYKLKGYATRAGAERHPRVKAGLADVVDIAE